MNIFQLQDTELCYGVSHPNPYNNNSNLISDPGDIIVMGVKKLE